MKLRPGHLLLLSLLLGCQGPSTPVSGGACPTQGEPACESAPARLLECRAGRWAVAVDCLGPRGCVTTADTVSCDTTGNGAGTVCASASEGKLRCEPDGGTAILQCVRGVLTVREPCPVGTTCGVVPDAGLACAP